MRILLLGGTADASAMARALAQGGYDAVFSYAGRTAAPLVQPLPTRVGGFGGVAGLVAYLRHHRITHVIDATHPFAAGMSTNAVAACAQTGVALTALEREPWTPQEGDRWHHVADIAGAVLALPVQPARVFLAIGRQHLAAFAGLDHHWLLRMVDPAPQPLPRAAVVVGRGPFDVASDMVLMQAHAITHLVAKNAGGHSASAKLTAARILGLPVVMIERPAVPERRVCRSVEAVIDWLHAGVWAERGV